MSLVRVWTIGLKKKLSPPSGPPASSTEATSRNPRLGRKKLFRVS